MHLNDYKAGFVTIMGKPNAGKSTLINLLIREPLAITHAKAQTTRHKLYGIVSEKNFQIIYTDTPGIITPAYPLQRAMMETVKNAYADADVIVWITDVREIEIPSWVKENRNKKPIILVLNKIDLIPAEQLTSILSRWPNHNPEIEIIPLSALKNTNTDLLIQRIVHWLPIHPPYYPEETLTDRPERFFAQEIIREKILNHYEQEIPYSVEVVVDTFKEKGSLIKIGAIIHVERQTQKGIIIGHRGNALKQLGIHAREALETFFQKKIFLEQYVKVTPNWRKNALLLTKFGYPNSQKQIEFLI